MLDDKKTCFVIMPFSTTTPEHSEDYWSRHYANFLKPLIDETPSLQARRSEPLRGDVLKQIILDLTSATIVVADLTDTNPNVYWELGVRQSFKYGTITIAQSGTHIPFDMGAKGILWYFPNDYVKNEEFRRRFQAALRDCLNQPEQPDSQVLETLTGRNTLFERFRSQEAIRRIDGLLAEMLQNFHWLNRIEIDLQKMRDDVNYFTTFTGHFLLPATQLLLTNRYLDEKLSFYHDLMHYAISIDSVDSFVMRMSHRPDDTQLQTMLERTQDIMKLHMTIRDELIVTRKKL